MSTNLARGIGPGNANINLHSMVRLNSGHLMPMLGFGVYKTAPEETEQAVRHALTAGYRHVDSARAYYNEGPCARAMLSSGIPRQDLFFTSKVPPNSLSFDQAKANVDATLNETKLDYIDLYLLHAPMGGKDARLGAWQALVQAVEDGKVRSIGVSNYAVRHLEELEQYINETDQKQGKGKGGVLSVNQVELHPWMARPDITTWCKQRGVVCEAWGPLARGKKFGDARLKAITDRTGATEAQVLVRWSLQMGFVPLPKSTTEARIFENSGVSNFSLTPDEMKSLDTGEYLVTGWDPTTTTD